MEFTEEQTNLIDNFINHPLILVFALAGTGKTTSLVSIAMKYSSLKGLYLVFNKANKDEGKVRFPKNFQVSNLHSLAWWALKKYSNINLNSIRNKDYKEIEISRILGISQKESKGVLSVFNKFLNSSLNEIEGDKQIFKNAKRLYEMMKNGEIAITHNFYMMIISTSRTIKILMIMYRGQKKLRVFLWIWLKKMMKKENILSNMHKV